MNAIHEQNSCHGKVRHVTKSSAKRAMKLLRKHDRKGIFEVYSCAYCQGFHFGNKRPEFVLTPISQEAVTCQ